MPSWNSQSSMLDNKINTKQIVLRKEMHVHLGSTYVLCVHASMNRHIDIINISSNLLNIHHVPETVNTVATL